MKVLWCWRCKAEVPMLSDGEWDAVWRAYSNSSEREHDGRPAGLREYERLTGHREENFNCLFHHRISLHGPPCPGCGKVLRTPVAYKCFECGKVVHTPGWSHLFRLEVGAFFIKGRGLLVVPPETALRRGLTTGCEVEFREGSRTVGRGVVTQIGGFHGTPPGNTNVGVIVDTEVRANEIREGLDVWLVVRGGAEG